MIRTIVVSLLLGVFVAGTGNPAFDEPRRAKLPVGPASRRGARQSHPKPGHDPNELRVALESALRPGEEVELTAQGVGCTLVLTNQRLLVVREGASYRPTSGIRAWHLDRDLRLRLGRAYRQTHRLAIGDAAHSASVFISTDDAADAQRLIAEARLRSFTEDDGD